MVCGQCHVEYYCGPKTTLFFPWNNGLKVEQIEAYYDSYKFPDGHKFFVDGGWVLVRASGTEPLIRVYAEGGSTAMVDALLEGVTQHRELPSHH